MVATAPRVGLVLGAGGVAGGAFHSGVLAALAEVTGWDPRRAAVIVGTSAGSITGTSLRAGLSAPDLLARSEGRPLSAQGNAVLRRVGPLRSPPPLRPTRQVRRPAEVAAILRRAAARPFAAPPWALLSALMPDGSVSTDIIAEGIAGLFPHGWPDDPLWICAVRQVDGRRVVFGRDSQPSLHDAVAASCAIPGFFTPVAIDDTAYVDGGVHSPTNADVLADPALGISLVLVSSPMSRSGRALRLGVDQPVRRWCSGLLGAEAVRLRRRGTHVLAFQPTDADAAVMGPNAMDPRRRAAIARQAYESTHRRLEREDTRARLAPLLG